MTNDIALKRKIGEHVGKTGHAKMFSAFFRFSVILKIFLKKPFEEVLSARNLIAI